MLKCVLHTLSAVEYIMNVAIISFSPNVTAPSVGDISEVAFTTVQFTVTSPNRPRVLCTVNSALYGVISPLNSGGTSAAMFQISQHTAYIQPLQ